jgi:hypothetical protein
MSRPTDQPPAAGATKLKRSDRINDPSRLAEVIPPTLAAELGSCPELKAHRALVKRCEAARARLRELEQTHREAVEADARAEREFAADPRAKLAAAAAPGAAGELEQARRELAALESRLWPSANELFGAAVGHVEAAAEQVERRLREGDDRVERLVGEALAALDERAVSGRELAWLERALWEPAVFPFLAQTAAVSSSQAARELRAALAALQDERRRAQERKFQAEVEREMLFTPDRRPKPATGQSIDQRRPEAEAKVRERMAAA